MKIEKNKNMVIGLVSMQSINSKNSDDILRYKATKVYEKSDTYLLYNECEEIIKDVYNKIISGEITFTFIKNFDKSRVKIVYNKFTGYSDITYYTGNEHDELLCCYMIADIHLFSNYFSYQLVVVNDDSNEGQYLLQKHGMYWYLLTNINDNPLLNKRFPWFTKLDTMVDYIFNKFEYNALRWRANEI